MESRGCTCPVPITPLGHLMECYYSKQRCLARMDGRETPQDSICPMCQAPKHPLNQLCYKCHDAMNTLPRVGDGFHLKSGSTWVVKNTPMCVLSGQDTTKPTPPQRPNTPDNVPGALVNVSCVAPKPEQGPAKSRARVNQKRRDSQLKRARGGSLVQAAVVRDLAAARGELDAVRETIKCTLEDEKEKESPSPRSAKDVENTTDAAGQEESPEETGPQFTIPKGLSRAIKSKLHEDMPGVRFVEEGADTKPMLLKRLYEKYCVQQLVSDPKDVVVIGRERYDGCVHRHHIQSSDDVGVEPDCVCSPDETCNKCEVRRWVIVDMIQQWSPVQIATVLLSDPAPEVYSVQYEYRAARGGHHVVPGGLPEVRWERTVDGLRVCDDQHMAKYRKDPADWTLTGGCSVGKFALCWNVVSKVGDCIVIRFHLVETELAGSFERDPMMDSYYGDTTPDQVGLGDPRSVELQAIVGPISKMYSAGDAFHCLVDTQQILVPKQGVGHIALWAAGKPREQRTYADAYIQARQWLKTTQLSTLERADCIPYIVAFGLIRTINTEAKAIACLGSNAHAVALHNDLVSDPFAPPIPAAMIRWKNWFVDNKRWLSPLAGAISALAVYTVGVFNKGKIVNTLTAAYNLWVKLRPVVKVAPGTSPVLSLLLYALNLVMSFLLRRKGTVVGPLQTYCSRGRELKEMRDGAKCRIRSVDIAPQAENADDVDCHATEGPFHVGLGITGFVPVIARHCIHNDLCAVRNRGICKRAPAQTGWWNTVGRRRMFTLFGGIGPIEPTPRPKWLERYPGRKRRELDKALSNDVEDYYAITHRKAFTKTECAVKRGEITIDEPLGEIQGFDPRLIQGCLPEYVNATGPFAHAYSKACKGEHGDTTYGPGLNAEALDEWLELAEAAFDEPVAYMDSDAVRLDASVDEECIRVEADLYQHLGADDEAVRMFNADAVTHGATPFGVVYQVDGTVPSGKTTTTCGNTTAVITVVEEALKNIPHKAIVAGDDVAVLVPLRFVKVAKEVLLLTGKLAGFEFKIKASRYRWDMEFCSGRWWPAGTPAGFAFGPKPGKLLPKLFFASTLGAYEKNILGYCKAICESMHSNVAHLPIAREFVDQVWSIASRSKSATWIEKKLLSSNLQNIRRQQIVRESPEIWEAYQHIYGLSRYDAESAIREIRKVKTLPDMVEHPAFAMMVAQDAPPVGDPDDRDPLLLAQGNLYGKVDRWLSFVSPLLEEWQRSKSPRVATASLVIAEAASWWWRGGNMWGYLPAAAMHCTAMGLHLKGHPFAALGLHYAFNVGVYLWNTRGGGRTASGNVIKSVVSSLLGASRPGVLPQVNQTAMQVALPQRSRNRRSNRKKGALVPPPLPPRGTRQYMIAASRLMPRKPRPPRSRAPSGRKRGGRARRANVVGAAGGGQLLSSKRVFGNSYNRSAGTRVKVVENDEFIGAVNGSVTFVNTAFACNPGQAATFPWLAVEAKQWEKYVFEYLEFYYEHEVSEFATQGTTGKVILAFDYDAADSPPTSKQQMENTDPHMDGMPCEDLLLRCDPGELSGRTDLHYVRPGNVPGGADIRLYDVGIFNIATQGNANTTEAGELHVRYRCRFEVPVLEATASAPANNQVSWFQSTAFQTYTTNTPTTALNATASVNGLKIVNTSGSCVPPAGNYAVDFTALIKDSAAEGFSVVCDLQKNAASVYAVSDTIPGFITGTSLGAGEKDSVAGSVFVSCNGTDAITQVLTIVGAAGTLTAGTSLRFIAV